jgi:hypothetical protein
VVDTSAVVFFVCIGNQSKATLFKVQLPKHFLNSGGILI